MCEWQAVVLCGGVGNRMSELTDHIPKCLLPVAGIPMFWYPLNFLQRNDIKDVILVVGERQLVEVKELLAGGKLPPLVDLSVDFVPLSSTADEWGTADVLRHIDSKIKRDFIVVSGDFVSDMNLMPMLALHRARNTTLTCLLAENVVTGPVPGPKIRRSKGRDFIALSDTNQILFLGSEEDFDDSIPMSSHLFSRFKNVNLTVKYNDCHVYLMKRWIMDVVKKERTFSSIKADLLPYLIEKQYSTLEPDLASYVQDDRLTELANLFSFGASRPNTPRVLCLAYVLTPENGSVIAHVNNIGAYFEVNKAILRFVPGRFSESFPLSAPVEAHASVSESYVAAGTLFGGDDSVGRVDKPVIKRSMIGTGCFVSPQARITNSLIMNSCVIGSGVQITNSIICNEVTVEEGAEVVSSIVVNRQTVAANSKVINEVISPEDEMDIDE